MTKDDWIKLAMPASITLLAAAIFTVPYAANALQILQIQGTGYNMVPLVVRIVE